MNNKNGFTLVELLAVIVILALIITIAVPSTISISNRIRENMFCSKIDLIETDAKLYGEDRRDSFKTIVVDEVEVKGKEITVEELVNTNYLKKDQSSSPYIQDPRDKSGLDDKKLTIYIKNERIYVKFWDEAIITCKK